MHPTDRASMPARHTFGHFTGAPASRGRGPTVDRNHFQATYGGRTIPASDRRTHYDRVTNLWLHNNYNNDDADSFFGSSYRYNRGPSLFDTGYSSYHRTPHNPLITHHVTRRDPSVGCGFLTAALLATCMCCALSNDY